MKVFKLFLFCTLFSGCGSVTSSEPAKIVDPGPSPIPHGTKHVRFTASRTGSTVVNGTFTITNESCFNLPLPSEIIVTNNSSSAFTMTVIIKNTTCTYSHTASSAVMNSVVCSPAGSTQVYTTTNDSCLFTINPGPSSLTSVEVDTKLDF